MTITIDALYPIAKAFAKVPEPEGLGAEALCSAERTRRALTALQAYGEHSGSGYAAGEPLYEYVSDLLTDLQHLCDTFAPIPDEGFTFDALLDRARSNYREEIST